MQQQHESKPADPQRALQPGRNPVPAGPVAEHPVLRLQRTIGNRATRRLIQREEAGRPTPEELEDPEARRRFRRETGGRMFRFVRWVSRIAPAPLRPLIRRLYGDIPEQALEQGGEAMERGHERRDSRIREIENEAY